MALKAVVYSLSGRSWKVDGQQGWSVLDVMKALEDTSGVPRRDQRLILGDQELKESDLLSADEEVHLSLLVRNPEIGAWLQKLKTSEFPQDLFRSAPEHIRDNQEIALAVVSRHGFSLKFASHKLRDDRQVVLAAVQQTGAALAYASETLKAEKDLVLLAVRRHGAALEHASQDLQSDREVAGFPTICSWTAGSLGFTSPPQRSWRRCPIKPVPFALRPRSSARMRKWLQWLP